MADVASTSLVFHPPGEDLKRRPLASPDFALTRAPSIPTVTYLAGSAAERCADQLMLDSLAQTNVPQIPYAHVVSVFRGKGPLLFKTLPPDFPFSPERG